MTAAIDVVLYLPTIAVHWWPFLAAALLLLPFVWPWAKAAL